MFMGLKENLVRVRVAKGLSQAELGSLSGCSQQVIADIESGRTLRPRAIHEIAHALNTTVEELDPDRFKKQARQGVLSSRAAPPAEILGARDLPIYASAEGGGGSIIMTFEPIDFITRPAPLMNVRDAYAIYVVGESMAPAYEPGDTALVNPHLPPAPGRDVILSKGIDGHSEALIKRMVKASATDWHVQQWNPAKTFTLPRKEWVTCHIVIGKFGR